MKCVFKSAALLTAAMMLSVSASASQINIVAPKTGDISVTNVGEGATDYEVSAITPENGKNVLVTKNGTVLLLGGTDVEEMTLSGSGSSVSVNVHQPIECDFDETQSDLIDAVTKTLSGNEYAYATAKKNTVLDVSSMNLQSGVLNVEFDMLMEDALKTNLISVCDAYGNVFAEAELRFRYDDAVYVAYKRDRYNYTPLRSKQLPTDEWVHINAEINLDTRTMSLKTGDEVIFTNAAFVGTPESVDSIMIGTNADAFVVYTGKIIDTVALNIKSDTVDVNTTGGAMVNVPLEAQIKTNAAFEDVKPEYLSWQVEDNSVCTISQTGTLTVDSALLTESTTVNVAVSLAIGKSVVTTQKEITLSPSDSGGEASTVVSVGGVSLSKSTGIGSGDTVTVNVPIYNPTAQDESYYIVTALQDSNGKNIQNFVFRTTVPANSGRAVYSYNMNISSGSGLSATVFVMDKNFNINVIRK